MRRRFLSVLLTAIAVLCLVPSVALAKSSPRLTISASSIYEHFDKKPTISGRLTTASGKPIAKATVKLYCGTKLVASKKTDARGKVAFSASLPGARMSGTWKLKFAGTRAYRAAASAGRTTRIHVHFEGPAGLVGDLADETGDTLDDGTGDVVDDGTDDGTDEVVPDDGIDSGLDDGSPYASGMRASVLPDEDVPADDVTDEPADDVIDVPEEELPAEPAAGEYGFTVNVFLDKGHRYAVEVGEPSRYRITDSAGDEVASGDEFDDVILFTAPEGDDYTFHFDTGLSIEELDELFVLIW